MLRKEYTLTNYTEKGCIYPQIQRTGLLVFQNDKQYVDAAVSLQEYPRLDDPQANVYGIRKFSHWLTPVFETGHW